MSPAVNQCCVLPVFATCVAQMANGENETASRDGEPEKAGARFEKVADPLSFPEGPAWDGVDTRYFSACRGEAVHHVKQGVATVFLRSSTSPFTFEETNGITVSFSVAKTFELLF